MTTRAGLKPWLVSIRAFELGRSKRRRQYSSAFVNGSPLSQKKSNRGFSRNLPTPRARKPAIAASRKQVTTWITPHSLEPWFAAEEHHQLDHQNNHHHQFEDEGAALVEFVDHEVVE